MIFCFSFPNLGIQCVRRKEVRSALIERVNHFNINPFSTSFIPDEIPDFDLNVVRLCFEAFLPDITGEHYSIRVGPTVSKPIYDKSKTTKSIFSLLFYNFNFFVSFRGYFFINFKDLPTGSSSWYLPW